jgi:hypothetical protein
LIPSVSALGPGDRGPTSHRDPGCPQGAGGIRDRAAGGHQIVDDHDPADGPDQLRRSTTVRGELPGRGPPALGRGQPCGVGSAGGQPEHGGHPRADPGPGEHPDRAYGETMDVLPAALPGDRPGRRDRDQPHLTRPAQQHLHGGGERDRERTGEIPPSALLVRQQAGPGRSRVRSGHRQRRKAGRTGIRTVRARVMQSPAAPLAQRSAGIGAAGTAARQDQVGQDGVHAATVAPRTDAEQSRFAICG